MKYTVGVCVDLVQYIVIQHLKACCPSTAAVERAVEVTLENQFAELQKGENILEGLKAFSEKREPQWKGSKL